MVAVVDSAFTKAMVKELQDLEATADRFRAETEADDLYVLRLLDEIQTRKMVVAVARRQDNVIWRTLELGYCLRHNAGNYARLDQNLAAIAGMLDPKPAAAPKPPE